MADDQERDLRFVRRGALRQLALAAGSASKLALLLDRQPGYINNLLNERLDKPFGEKFARYVEDRLHLVRSSLDQDHDEQWAVRALQGAYPEQQITPREGQIVINDEPAEFPLKGGALDLEQFDVRGSLGHGIPLMERESVIDLIRVPLHYVRERFPHITSPKNLKIITGFGDSMKPTFNHGDPLIVDTGVHTMDIDTIYTFAYQNELYIKRIQRLPDRSIKVISDNRVVYDPYILDAKQREEVEVIARVVCAVNMNTIS